MQKNFFKYVSYLTISTLREICLLVTEHYRLADCVHVSAGNGLAGILLEVSNLTGADLAFKSAQSLANVGTHHFVELKKFPIIEKKINKKIKKKL